MAEGSNTGSADIQKLVKNHTDNTRILYVLVFLLALVAAFYLFLLYGHNRPPKYSFARWDKIDDFSVCSRDERTIAVLTRDTIFLSTDAGNHFVAINIPADTINESRLRTVNLAPDGKTIALITNIADRDYSAKIYCPDKIWSKVIKFSNQELGGICFNPDSAQAYVYSNSPDYPFGLSGINQLSWNDDSLIYTPITVKWPPGFTPMAIEDMVYQQIYSSSFKPVALTAYGHLEGMKKPGLNVKTAGRAGYSTIVNFDKPNAEYYTDSLLTDGFAKSQNWRSAFLLQRKLYYGYDGLVAYTSLFGDSIAGSPHRCIFETVFPEGRSFRIPKNEFVIPGSSLAISLDNSFPHVISWTNTDNVVCDINGDYSVTDTIKAADGINEVVSGNGIIYASVRNSGGQFLARRIMRDHWQIVPLYYATQPVIKWQQKWYLLPLPVLVFLLGFILVLLYNNRQLSHEVNQKLQRKPDILELFNDQPLQYEPGSEGD